MKSCEYCGRKSTRLYNGKNLCEFHYLMENPKRNRALVDWRKLAKLKALSSDDWLFMVKQQGVHLKEVLNEPGKM